MWGASDLRVAFATGRGTEQVLALDGVGIELPPGSVQAVVGGDGAGKTTLLDVLVGRVLPASGRVDVPSARDIGFMPATSGVWRELSVDENISFVAEAYGVRAGELERRRADLLDRAGLTEARGRLGGHLSGGMRQKLGVCLALLHEPALLVLDEPSTGVDPVSRIELWRMVAEAAARGTAVVMATTYLDEAERAASVLVLDEGSTLYTGVPSAVRAAVPGVVTTEASVAGPLAPTSWRRGRALRTWSSGATGHPGATVIEPDLEDSVIALTLARRAAGGAGDLPGTTTPTAAPIDPANEDPHPGATQPGPTDGPGGARRPRTGTAPLVEVHAAVKRFGHMTALDGAGVRVEAGEIVGLLGANGAGKTTLIRLMLGLEAADGGSVAIFGAAPSRSTRARLGYMPQGLGMYQELTVRQNVDFVAGAFGVRPGALPDALHRVADRPVGEIGLGLQRRLAFHCALLHDPELLVLDEPTSGVDPLARARLWDTVHAAADRGLGVLVTTHYMQEAQQCDRLVLLSRGRVVAAGVESEIIGAATTVVVSGGRWEDTFAALGRDAAVTLAGTEVRVAGRTPEEVLASTRAAGLRDLTVREVPATLEERMALMR